MMLAKQRCKAILRQAAGPILWHKRHTMPRLGALASITRMPIGSGMTRLGLANGWNDPSSSDGRYAIFRTNNVVAAVPEASTYAMLLGGLGLLGFLRRRQKAA